ncbi:GNAT family N-acetyltransferase [Kribbella deserti]|uniref:Lysine N-acyltransferase MbtK n=1 Tax=Kribbella deserti TaxID=1926257 RepID=A0ABV6QMH7_9ACTN
MAVKVSRDAWGIPHLRSDTGARELAHLQGVNAARDRAWQIELERRRSLGSSAAVLGPAAIAWDRFARQVRIDDTAQRCFASLQDETKSWLTAYVDGVNAALPSADAPEFAATGLIPGRWQPWSPIAIWLTTHVLFAGYPTKLWREQVSRQLGPEAADLFAIEGPGTAGSNGWLVDSNRSTTGKPIVAGDPHRLIESPGVYQQIHLVCPDYDVVGLAIPGVPGIAHFGHTGHVAWAITNAVADSQDLYRERLRRRNGQIEAEGPDGWYVVPAHAEFIEVAGGDPVEFEVIETQRGPIVAGGADEGEGLSLRLPPRVLESIGFDALPALLRAKTVHDVDAAFEQWVEPVNVVLAADTAGGTLHRAAGRVPERPERNSEQTVPATDARFEWQGWKPMPRATVEGVAVMANERGLAGPLGYDFAPPHRADRITALLAERDRWSPSEMAAIHTDTFNGAARVLLDHLARLKPDANGVRDLLLAWDRRMDADSIEAATFANLRSAVARHLAAHPVMARLDDPAAYPQIFDLWTGLGTRIAYALENILVRGVPGIDLGAVVRAALAETKVAAEPWGATHRLFALHAFAGTSEGADYQAPAVVLAGDNDCVWSTTSVPGVSDICVRGSVARYVWDLADRSASRWIVPLGASGIPGHPHSQDQLALWQRGELVPVVTDWSLLTEEDSMYASFAPAAFTQVVDGFGEVSIVPVDPERDLDLIYSWVTAERARFWGMTEHSREFVLEIYQHLDSLATHHTYLVRRDGVPVALLQTYQPEADPVGECYDVQPGDIGAHLLLGPAEAYEPGFTGALMKVFLAFLFCDPANQRIVAEPDARNAKVVARLERTGFVLGPEIELPDKRAQLAFLTRETYVAAARVSA